MAQARVALGARSEDVRRRNLASVLRHVHVHGPTPRSVLTAQLALNRSTIGDLTAELAAAGLVREVVGQSAGATRSPAGRTGRPSHLVVPESDMVQVLAIDVGVTHLTVARMGLGGPLLSRRDVRLRQRRRALTRLVHSAAELAAKLIAELPAGAVVVGAGIAVPGVVRASDGLVRQAPNLDWTDVPLGAALRSELSLPVSVGNDADLGALAEHIRGAAVDSSDVVHLVGYSGIGAGIFTSGRPLVGRRGYAGEVGHVVVDPGGRPCHCGSRGCWETVIGEERLFELAGRPPGGGLTEVRQVVAAAGEGEPRARAAVEEVARWLGVGAGALVNVFNPEVVIFGGTLAEVFTAAADIVRESVAAVALAPALDGVRLVTPAFGADSTLIGAGELAFAPLLADPLRETFRRDAS